MESFINFESLLENIPLATFLGSLIVISAVAATTWGATRSYALLDSLYARGAVAVMSGRQAGKQEIEAAANNSDSAGISETEQIFESQELSEEELTSPITIAEEETVLNSETVQKQYPIEEILLSKNDVPETDSIILDIPQPISESLERGETPEEMSTITLSVPLPDIQPTEQQPEEEAEQVEEKLEEVKPELETKESAEEVASEKPSKVSATKLIFPKKPKQKAEEEDSPAFDKKDFVDSLFS